MANVVFDLGGVVFNWQPRDLMREALPEMQLNDVQAQALAQKIFQSFAQTGDWAAFDLGLIEPDPLAQAIAMRAGLKATEVRRVIDTIPSHLTPIVGTVALMEKLKSQGHRLFYLSNMPIPYANHLERSHAFFDWFDDGIFSCRVQLIKPQPEIFQRATEQFGVKSSQAVFIDDVTHNVEAARAQGWSGVQFHDPAQVEAELKRIFSS